LDRLIGRDGRHLLHHVFCNCNLAGASDVEEMTGCDCLMGQSLEVAIGIVVEKRQKTPAGIICCRFAGDNLQYRARTASKFLTSIQLRGFLCAHLVL
jgi:hypothetical protein